MSYMKVLSVTTRFSQFADIILVVILSALTVSLTRVIGPSIFIQVLHSVGNLAETNIIRLDLTVTMLLCTPSDSTKQNIKGHKIIPKASGLLNPWS